MPKRSQGSYEEIGTGGKQVRREIEHSLHARVSPRNTMARQVEDTVKGGVETVWNLLRRHPVLGTAAIGAGVVGAAGALGVAELALGVLTAYGAYQVLRSRGREA